jgi:cytochrome c-type biogenesis protein CcmH
MTLFWIIAAGMILLPLALVAPVLLRRRQVQSQDRDRQNIAIAREHLAEIEAERKRGMLSDEEFEQARQELEQALLTDLERSEEEIAPLDSSGEGVYGRSALGVLALVLPVAALSLYFLLGSPQLLDADAARRLAEAERAGQNGEAPSIEEMVATLRQRLEENPEDAEGWYMLGRSYMVLQRYAQAAEAYEQVHKRVGDHPNVMLALADALTMANGGVLAGRPAELIQKSVELDPDNNTALWLAGMVEEEAGNFEQALRYWRKLEPRLQGDAESQAQLRRLISRAEEKKDASAAPSAPPPK